MHAVPQVGHPALGTYETVRRELLVMQTRVDRRTVTELLVPTKRAAITLISHSIGGDAVAVVICLVDMHRVTVTV